MNKATAQFFPKPPSLVGALLAGFDATSSHISILIIPIVLDVLLWIGPRLRIDQLFEALIDQAKRLSETSTTGVDPLLGLNQQLLLTTAERFNLLSFLRAYPVGIPSLMAGRSPVANPLSWSVNWEVPSSGYFFGMFLLLSLVGLMAGTIFFSLVAQATMTKRIAWLQALQQWPWNFLQVISLTLFLLAVLSAAFIPLACISQVLFAISSSVGQGLLLVMGGITLWFLFPLIFSPLGIFANRLSMWASVKYSVRLTRATLPNTVLFFLAVVVLSQGLGLLWNTPSETSWLASLGIIGHAFISTSLLAAAFIYYREASQWMQKAYHPLRKPGQP